MIDIHAHILPGIDDGATSDEVAIEMARMAVRDGIRLMACTPHIMPPRYPNNSAIIASSVERLRERLKAEDIDLLLVSGADVHLSATLIEDLKSGTVPGIFKSAYFLLEPDHRILTPNLDKYCMALMRSGFRPVLTHPERLHWVGSNLDLIERLHKAGVVMQLTANSLTGRFGQECLRVSEILFERGLVDVLATDAHNTTSRPPILSEARNWVAQRYDEQTARRLTFDNPLAIVTGKDIIRADSAAVG